MNDEVAVWLGYAEENRRVAEMTLEAGLYNPSLQNAQQAVEKALKAACLTQGLTLRKTHSIQELVAILKTVGVETGLADEDCDLLDSIYLPSKYPLGSTLPNFQPDYSLAQHCLALTDKVLQSVNPQ